MGGSRMCRFLSFLLPGQHQSPALIPALILLVPPPPPRGGAGASRVGGWGTVTCTFPFQAVLVGAGCSAVLELLPLLELPAGTDTLFAVVLRRGLWFLFGSPRGSGEMVAGKP